MKVKNLFLSVAVLATAFSSCMDEKEHNYNPNQDGSVTFNSTINGDATQTRAANAAWDAGDAIGIFMKRGAGLGTIVDGATNKKHTTAVGGVFAPANPATDAIHIPTTGGPVDFIAYYPHTTALAGTTYKVDLSNQAVQEDIDLMYSNDAVGKTSASTAVTLNFTHQLSKVVFTINAGANVSSLAGLTVKIDGMDTQADYDLATGTLGTQSAPAAITLLTTVVTPGNVQAIAEAIFMPTTATATNTVTFSVGGKDFTWDPTGQVFDAGKKSTYLVELKDGGQASVVLTGNIEDWGPGSSENIVLDPNGVTPGHTGTKADPFTVSEAKTKAGETAKWVTGYIVGSTNSTKALGTPSKLNILLAEAPGESDESKCIPVDINGSSVQANLDIVEYPALIGKLVKIEGNIVSGIFGDVVGITGVTNQEGGQEINDNKVTVTIIDENFGTTTSATERAKVGAYANYKMKSPIVYSDAYGTWADIRTSNSFLSNYNMHVWLPAYASDKKSSFTIEGIETGYTEMTLTYEIASNASAGANANVIQVICNDGTPVTVPSTNLPTQNEFKKITIQLPDNTTKIEFLSDSRNSVGMRIDNILVQGKK